MMISFVIPVFNEKESLQAFYERLKPQATALSKSHEIIFIDDGSTDTSLDLLKNFAEKDKSIRIFSFRRNQGKAEALTLGFQQARGEKIVTLDADLQDKPEEIHKLLKGLEEGYDISCGWRKDRKDSLPKKLASKFFNNLMGTIWGVRLHDYNCGLKAYTSDAAKSLYLYGGMHRFIPLLAYEQGFQVNEVAIIHDKRKFGKSKFGISKLWRDIPDMFTILFLTRFGKKPLHFFWLVGGVFAAIGIGILLYFWALHTLSGRPVQQRPLLYIGMIGILAGFQIFFTGFLADLLINLFHQSQATSEEVVQKRLLKYTNDTI